MITRGKLCIFGPSAVAKTGYGTASHIRNACIKLSKRERGGGAKRRSLRKWKRYFFLFRLIPCTMGSNASQLEKDIGAELFPSNEHYFGLVSINIF